MELGAVADSRQQLADHIYTPWWYHPLLGALCGVVLLAIGDSFDRGMFVLPFAVLGIIGLGPLYRHLSGVDLSGVNAPTGGRRGRFNLAAVLVCFSVCFAASYFLGRELSWAWAPWVLAGAMVLTTTIAGRAYDGSIRAQVRGPQS